MDDLAAEGVTAKGFVVESAAESACGQLLHDALADQGVHVGQLIIPFGIGDGRAEHAPEAVAELLWTMHAERGAHRVHAEDLDA